MQDKISFSVLGPMTISKERDTVILPSSKPTILLAAMLLRPGEVLSAEFLQRVIWDDVVPDSARATLQTYILRLRQLFAKFGIAHDAIRTVPGGYCLPVAEDSLDLAAFRGLVKASRTQPAPEAELRLLNQALALWRGTPITNIRSDLLHRDEVPGLCDEWIHASERCFDLQFNLGQYHQALPRLRAMAQAHPGHERIWEQLIEALHQVGRTAEALAGYRFVKQYLAEEYGIDPGPGLQRLELSILRGTEPRFSVTGGRSNATASRAAVTAADPPGQFGLPGDLPDFAGRAPEIGELRWRLTQHSASPVVAVISGPPSVGKTALATHVAHLLKTEFPGGCRFVRLADYDGNAGVAAERMNVVLGHDGTAGERRTLTIVDGVDSASQIGPFLPTDSNTALVATSRQSLACLAATRAASLHRLVALEPADSLSLLRSVLGPRLDRDIPAARELASLCGHFPAAVRIAATRLTTSARLTLAEFTEGMRYDPIRLLSLPGDPDGSVRAIFDSYMKTLDAGTADAFFAIGSRGPGPFTLAECAKIIDLSEKNAESLIGQLVDRCLLENESISEYRIQDLLCAFARDRIEDRGYPDE